MRSLCSICLLFGHHFGKRFFCRSARAGHFIHEWMPAKWLLCEYTGGGRGGYGGRERQHANCRVDRLFRKIWNCLRRMWEMCGGERHNRKLMIRYVYPNRMKHMHSHVSIWVRLRIDLFLQYCSSCTDQWASIQREKRAGCSNGAAVVVVFMAAQYDFQLTPVCMQYH